MSEVVRTVISKEGESTLETISQYIGTPAEYAVMWQVLLSLRRVTAVMRTGKGVAKSPTYTNPAVDVPLVQYELQSLHGLSVSDADVKMSLRRLAQIEWACEPISNQATRRAMWLDPCVDFNETSQCARKGTERAIWDRWNPPFDAQDAPESLVSTVRGYLHHLPQIVRRSAYHGMNQGKMYSLDAFGEEKGTGTKVASWDERFSPPTQSGTVFETSSPKSLRHAMDIWYEQVHDMDIREVFTRIAHLRPVHQLVLLDRFKYINPSFSSAKRIDMYGMDRALYASHVVQAVKAFQTQSQTKYKLGTQTKGDNVLISDILSSALTAREIQMNGRVIHYDSPRIGLLAALDAGKIDRVLTSLDSRKQQIVRLAIELSTDGRCFIHNNSQIGAIVGVSVDVVEVALHEASQILYTGTSKMVGHPNPGGSIILDNSKQAELIQLAQAGDLTPTQRAALTPQMLTIYTMLTTPDASGTYHRWVDVEKAGIGRDSTLVVKIRDALRDVQWVDETILQVTQALSMPSNFTANELKIIKEIEFRIQEGIPLRSKTQTGVAWAEIARSLGIPEHNLNILKKKLKDKHPK